MPIASSPSTAAQSSFETTAPVSPRYPTRNRKSTQQPDFIYSCYSSSFVSFLASVHRLSEPFDEPKSHLFLGHFSVLFLAIFE